MGNAGSILIKLVANRCRSLDRNTHTDVIHFNVFDLEMECNNFVVRWHRPRCGRLLVERSASQDAEPQSSDQVSIGGCGDAIDARWLPTGQ